MNFVYLIKVIPISITINKIYNKILQILDKILQIFMVTKINNLRVTKNYQYNNLLYIYIILLLYSKIDTSLWTVITDYFYYFQTMDIFIHHLFIKHSSTHTWIAIKIHPATLSHRLLINQWNVTVVAGVFSKRFNLCTIFTRRMIEGEKKKEEKKREREIVSIIIIIIIMR